MRKLLDIIHHFFIPREKNNYRAKAIHVHSLATYLLFFVAVSFFFSYSDETNNILGYATDVTIDRLYILTNQEREKHGLSSLSYNEDLSVAAAQKAQDMFEQNYWAHYGPDGTTPWSFILATGYKYEYAGENLAKNFMFSDGVVQAWMDSPTHRDNILRAEYEEIGFAVANGVLNGEETTLVVQMFGTPLDGVIAESNPPERDLAQEQSPEENVAAPAQEPVPVSNLNNARPNLQIENGVSPNTKGVSWSRLLYNSKLFFIVFLVIAFALDLFVAIRLNIVQLHVGGKHTAHIIFLLFIIAGLLIISQGKIL